MPGSLFWRCSFEVEATSEQAGQLRRLVPELLETAGYKVTAGTRTVELSYAEAAERLAARARLNGNGRGRDVWMPVRHVRREGSG